MRFIGVGRYKEMNTAQNIVVSHTANVLNVNLNKEEKALIPNTYFYSNWKIQ